MAGIQQSLEIFDLGDSVAKAVIESKSDGDIDWMDIPKFAPVVSAAKRAADGSDQIPVELKDLSPEEIEQLVVRAHKTVANLVAALLKK